MKKPLVWMPMSIAPALGGRGLVAEGSLTIE
jgi:hypothetical protein